ncbi:MAG: methionyl-tRNA formyltransferase [Parcubacteria group bacterium]|nr:methionyl-tRNA formyltransferase [Parcubacteria group bacterium]
MRKTTKTLIFFGTPEFAVPSLSKISKSFEIKAVFCEPDRPVGRKQELKEPPVKKTAKKLGLKIFQPESIKKQEEVIRKLNPDIAVIVAYGQLIPKRILSIPKFGFINLHPSLLPKYRGPSPIQSTILNGDKETGVSIIILDEKMDHGPILSQKKIKIEKDETAESLHEKSSKIGADLITKTANDLVSGKIKGKEQNHKKATFTKILKREDGKINFEKSAEENERMVRAYSPWPGTFTEINGKRLKIISAYIYKKEEHQKTGVFFEAKNKKLAVKCKKEALVLERVQLEGKKEMSGEEFLKGNKNLL